MRRVALIYNPVSGQYSARRATVIPDALAMLRSAGIEAEALETNAPGSAGVRAEEAIRRGCDTILACGEMAPFTRFCSVWWALPLRWAWSPWARPMRWLRIWAWANLH